jgi:hypothetical protein
MSTRTGSQNVVDSPRNDCSANHEATCTETSVRARRSRLPHATTDLRWIAPRVRVYLPDQATYRRPPGSAPGVRGPGTSSRRTANRRPRIVRTGWLPGEIIHSWFLSTDMRRWPERMSAAHTRRHPGPRGKVNIQYAKGCRWNSQHRRPLQLSRDTMGGVVADEPAVLVDARFRERHR